MFNMQALIDGMSAQWQRERAETQMTLGKMIDALEKCDGNTNVAVSSSAHSYRGYYSDLSFEPGESTAGELLAECRKAMGAVFEGYKGGEFVMGALTPVWVAHYGCCGKRLMNIAPDGQVELSDEEA